MGLFLNGSSHIDTPGNYVRTSTDHTVMFWLRLDSTSRVSRPFGNAGLWESRTASGSTLLTSDYLQSGASANVTLTLGQWQHVAFVQDVTGGIKTSYLDGQQAASIGGSFPGNQTGILRIGTAPGGTNQDWQGGIEDIRIYERALEADEIATIFATCGTDGIIDDISHWWPMDEGPEGSSATNVIDVISGLNCTVVSGSPVYDYSAGLKRRRVS